MINPIIPHLLEFILACVALAACTHLLIRSMITISRFLRISEFTAAFIVMAFATSLPELFVGITSAIEGKPIIALGLVIGSNIADLTIVMGTALIVGRNLKITRGVIRRNAWWMVFLSAIPVVLMAIGKELSRIDGIVLLMIFAAYQYRTFMESRRFTKPLKEPVSKRSVIAYSILLILTIAGLYASADWLVSSAIVISADLLIPPILISVIIIALGTSLPELAFETTSVMKKHGNLALGDVIGSVITNSTLVLGVTALISPISNNFLLFATSALFMVSVGVVFAVFVESDRLTWRSGIGLILLYILFVIVELQIKAFV